MRSLETAANLLSSAKELPGVLEEILEASLELHASQQGVLQLYDAASRQLRVAVQRGVLQELVEAWEALPSDANPILGRPASEARSVLFADLTQEAGPIGGLCLGHGIQALQCVPLVSRGGQLLGLMTLFFGSPQQGSERTTRITELMARFGADALERMRLDAERQRLLESEQHARRALDEAAHLRDEFLATLSHELRTPLSAILLWGKILRGAASDPEKSKRAVDAIIDSAESQARLIDDLLDSARAVSGKLRLEMQQIALTEIVRSVIAQNEPASRAKNLGIETKLDPAVGSVWADATRLRQVVWNLLINAVKFTPEGGKITVSLSRELDEVQLVVSDTGVGITSEFLPHIFDRFRQSDVSATRKGGGLGLGLTITRQLVEMHGGTIQAESAGHNRGASFTVKLPMPALRGGPAESRAAAETSAAEAPLSGKLILLIEDDPETQRALTLVLGEAGAAVTTASNKAEALAAYQESQPDLVLSDIRLPGFDGYTLLAQIRAFERERQLPETPAVALTAYDREQDRRNCAAAGFRTHLAKPVEPEKLLDVLTALLSSR